MLVRISTILLTFLFYSTATAEKVVLQWDANVEEDLAEYILYYGNRSGDLLGKRMKDVISLILIASGPFKVDIGQPFSFDNYVLLLIEVRDD